MLKRDVLMFSFNIQLQIIEVFGLVALVFVTFLSSADM